MDKYKDQNIWKTFNPTGEIIVALGIVLLLSILFIVVGIKAKKADPLKRPKGILLIAEWVVEKLDAFVVDMMGPGFDNFAGILLGIIPFVIRMGLEPMTRSLEGCCSNPTELPNQP